MEQLRQSRNLAMQQSGQEIAFGQSDALPWTLAELACVDRATTFVHQTFDAGLTALVHHLRCGDASYALKQARPHCLVQNIDGQTSFLNELLCRRHIEQLREHSSDAMAAFTKTHAASLRHGVIVTEWVDGDFVQVWDRRRLEQVFAAGSALLLAGLFEWDYAPGNILDDGCRLRMFDFGYTYPFDPLCQFNSAGLGNDLPMFHLAERFETRNYFGYLLQLEREQGLVAALAAYRLEKNVAIDAYRQLRDRLQERGAVPAVIDWLQGWIDEWTEALQGDLFRLYLKEGWRSHVLDLDDDLRGQTCTPSTLQRCEWILQALTQHHSTLETIGALFWQDVSKSRAQLLDAYRACQVLAQRHQLATVVPRP